MKSLKKMGTTNSPAHESQPTPPNEPLAQTGDSTEAPNSGQATPTNDDESEHATGTAQGLEEAVEKLGESAAALSIDLPKPTEPEPAQSAVRPHKQISPAEREIPPFLLVKLKHVDKAPHDLYTE